MGGEEVLLGVETKEPTENFGRCLMESGTDEKGQSISTEKRKKRGLNVLLGKVKKI